MMDTTSALKEEDGPPTTDALNLSATSSDSDIGEGKADETCVQTTDDILREIKIVIDSALTNQSPQIDSRGIYLENVRNAVNILSDAYYAFDELPGLGMKEIDDGRKDAGTLLVNSKSVDVIAEMYMAHMKLHLESFEDEIIKEVRVSLKHTASVLVNYSDLSDDFATALANVSGLLGFLRGKLATYLQSHRESTLGTMDVVHLEQILNMVHNMTMRESNITMFTKHSYTEVLQLYLNSEDPDIVVLSLASLAGIIDEEQAEIINTRPDIVKELFKWLEEGMADKLRRYCGWACSELAMIIQKLARNDSNKKQLVELGALELLVKLARTGDANEQHESVQAIWALSFDKDNRKKICSNNDLGVIELLTDLKSSVDRSIRKGCEGALWTLSKVSSQEKQLKKSTDMLVPNDGHIMISYQWADQYMLKRVRDGLKNAGFKVWMDIDQMGGSTVQAMAEAVENARIMLMSMTHKYKNSQYCRAEAEYAFKKNKTIVPLKLESGYTPDGWLGIIAGTKLYFEFTDNFPFDRKMRDLLKQIHSLNEAQDLIVPETASKTGSTRPLDTTDSSPTSPVPTTAKVTIDSIRHWSEKDVQIWINKHDLKSCELRNITGSEIAFLVKMQAEAPGSFYKTLRNTLNLKSLRSMTKVGWALSDLQADINKK